MKRVVQYEVIILGINKSTFQILILQGVEPKSVGQGGLLPSKCA